MKSMLGAVVLASFLFNSSAYADRTYDVHYRVSFVPKKDYARVEIRIDDAALLKRLEFRLDPQVHSKVKANGALTLESGRAIWDPPNRKAKLTLRSKISNERKKDRYDALMTADWAIFRGDDLVPPAKVRARKGAKSRSFLSFNLPRGWDSVNTGWARDDSGRKKAGQKNAPSFIIDNPERSFDRPTGWMIAGKLGTRREWLGETRVSVSAPEDTLFHRMDILTYLSLVWPEIERTFGQAPEKLLIVGGDDPMWRGGLSASNSLFLHADRPLVSENGTSTLLHEIVHMVTRIRGDEDDDWIAEGLAEYYAIELLFRSGGISEARRVSVQRMLQRWSEDVKSLRAKRSTGPRTARATLLFYDLDQEIRQQTEDKRSLDDLTRQLIDEREVSYAELKDFCKALVGANCKTLNDIR